MKAEEPIVEYGMLNPDGIYTYWDYLKWQFSERVELIRGKLFKMSPAPNVSHQQISANVSRIFLNIFHEKACRVFVAPFDVRLPIISSKKDSTVVQPDLCVVCNEVKLSDGRGCNGAPDLVIEILSPGNSRHEMDTKFRLYEESGVKEYWIVQPLQRTVLIYRLEEKGNKYSGLPPFVESMEVGSVLFPDLKMSVDDIFYKVSKEEI
jgi:Uma2 family endonuclease